MKQTWNLFLQKVSDLLKSLFANASVNMRKNARLMSAGITAVTLLTFAIGGLQETGGKAMVAFAETSVHTQKTETEVKNTAAEESVAEKDDVAEKNEIANETRKEREAVKVLEFIDPEEAARREEEKKKAEDKNAAEEKSEAEDKNEEEKSEAKKSAVLESVKLQNEETYVQDKISLPEDEYQILLKIVQAEAGNCDTKGKILVANVILNRVESDKFPDTVRGVVYQRHQFSPVSNGSINRCKVTDETVYAVDRALSGEDPSEGALYFMNRSASTGSNVRWFDNHLDYLFQHEQHEFFK